MPRPLNRALLGPLLRVTAALAVWLSPTLAAAAPPSSTPPPASPTAPAGPPPAAAAATSPADDLSFIGARTIAEDATALYATAGLPDVEVGAVLGLSTLADVTPRVRFQFGRGARVRGGGVGVSAAFRMKFAEWSGWTFAVIGAPEVALHISGKDHPTTTNAAGQSLLVTPFSGSLVADRLLLPSLRLVVGLDARVGFFATPEFVLHTPLAVQVGAELRVTDSLFMIAQLDTGFDFYSQGSLPGNETYLRARVGLGWSR